MDDADMRKKQTARAEDLLQKVKDGDPVANLIIAFAYCGKDSEEYDHYYPLCESFLNPTIN